MGMFDGKTGVIFGVANDRSIAWSITHKLAEEGATMGFTHLPDRDERNKNEKKVRKLVDPLGAKFVVPCNVMDDDHIDAVFAKVKDEFGTVDFVLHSIAGAPPGEISGPVYDVTRDGFKMAMEISAYSLIAIAKRAREVLNPGGNILALTYLGGERVVPGYNLMGLCKATLDSALKYLANELGESGLRVNAVSAGPVRTISAAGVGDFNMMLKLYESHSPLRRNIDPAEVGNSAAFLMSDMASGITGEILHVDCGYNILGGPPSHVLNATQNESEG